MSNVTLGHFALAVLVILVIMAFMDEKTALMFGVILVFGAIYVDQKHNGSNALINQVFGGSTQ